MRADRHWRARLLSLLFVASASSSAFSAFAADNSAELVKALRQRGWNDVAVDFLSWVESSPLASTATRTSAPFDRAIALADQGRQSKSRADRDRLLTEAAENFLSFADAQSAKLSGTDAADQDTLEAYKQAANLYAELAIAASSDAAKLQSAASAPREAALESARTSYAAAAKAIERLIALAGKPSAKDDALRSRLAEGRYLQALVSFESARTYDRKSDEFKSGLKKASEQFSKLADDYRDTLVGASSRFYEGRCAQELGSHAKALARYDELIQLPSPDPEFRRWTARAYRRRTECLIDLGKIDEAIQGCQNWLDASRPDEREKPEWLEVAFQLAQAYDARLKSPGDKPVKANQLQANARSLLREVAQHPNEFQERARVSLVAFSSKPEDDKQYKTFAAALAAAKESLELLSSSQMAVRLARENNPDSVAELQLQADQEKQTAERLVNKALDLSDSKTPTDDLNAARYYLCWLSWENGQYYDAAVLGDYLATRYPDGQFAASAARIALSAYQQLIRQSNSAKQPAGEKTTPSPFASDRLAALAELMASRWPDSPESASAVNVLVSDAIADGRIADAEALVARLPEASRTTAELSLGATQWEQYVKQTANSKTGPDAKAVTLRDKAGARLASGFAGLKKGGRPTTAATAAALYYSRFLLETGDVSKALAVLEDKKVGPLTLVTAGDEVASALPLVQETLKTALIANLLSSPPRRSEAAGLMDALEKSAAKSPENDRTVTLAYVAVARQLQKQIAAVATSDHADDVPKLLAALDDVLRRIAASPQADQWAIQVWLAAAQLDIGKALPGREQSSHLKAARKAYEAAIAETEQDPRKAPSADAVLAVRLRLAETLAALKEYDAALKQYEKLLLAKPNSVELQKAAATALQAQGAAQRDPKPLELAIHGTLPQKDGKNLIWGWLQIAKIADVQVQRAKRATSDPNASILAERFRDLLFEARYNVSKARFDAAMLNEPPVRQKQLIVARQSILLLSGQHPDLGGQRWKEMFDKLLDQIKAEEEKQ